MISGVSLLPEFIVRDALAEGTLVTVLDDCEFPAGAIFAVYPQHRHSSRAVGAFVDYLLDALPPMPPVSGGNST